MAMHRSPDSKVKSVLLQGRKDMWNSDLTGLTAKVFGPFRDFVLDPCFGIWGIVLPPLLGNGRADAVVATILYGIMLPLRLVYPPSFEIDLRRNAKNDIIITGKAGIRRLPFKPPSDIASAFYVAVAFVVSVTADLIGTIMHRKKMMKWLEAITEFKAYLDISGVGDELEEAIMKPLVRGRLLTNVKILNNVQEIMYADRGRAMHESSPESLKEPLLEGRRFMRFATAAYGTEMIRSTLDDEAGYHHLEDQTKAVAFHCGIDAQDIRILYVENGGDMKSLRHIVAIDRATRSVVLALRGTLSISGALIDMQGMDSDFCGGKAHKGMAEMAENVWNESGDAIAELFQQEELKDYTFIITGHSLGAGTACLLNIKVHLEKPLGDRLIKCYGFAPPPTYCIDKSLMDPTAKMSVQTAIHNSTCYMHDNDCVPLLSVVCIRRLAALMDAVDNKTEHMWALRRFKVFWEWESIPEDIVEDVKHADQTCKGRSACVDGASKLEIPAKIVIWMKKNGSHNRMEAFGCSPSAVADLNIFCCEDMIGDHLPEQYENALDALTE